MTKTLGVLSGLMLSGIALLWLFFLAALVLGGYSGTRGQLNILFVLLLVGIFLFASFSYLIISFRKLRLPAEAAEQVLDSHSVRGVYAPLAFWVRLMGILKALGGLGVLLFFVYVVVDIPPPLQTAEDLFAFVGFVSMVLLFVVVQWSYVYRSWKKIARNYAQHLSES